MAKLNHNVRLALWFTFASTAARQIWAFVTLSLYLKSLTGTNFSVGLSEGVQGGLQALTALTVGVYVDKARRDTGMQIAGTFGLVAIAVTLFTLIVSDDTLEDMFDTREKGSAERYRYIFMTTALSFWGMYQGVWNTVLETIYADSVTTGNRSDFNTRKFMLLQAASVIGPAIALILFLYEGDTWYHMTLRLVFIVGVVLCAPAAVMLFFFDDTHTLGDESEAVSHAPSRGSREPSRGNGRRGSVEEARPLLGGGSARSSRSPTPQQHHDSGSSLALPSGERDAAINGSPPPPPSTSALGARDAASKRSGGGEPDAKTSNMLTEVFYSVNALSTTSGERRRRFLCLTSSKVPHVLIVSDLISGLASGMTIKFFPLFFARKVWLSPVSVQAIYLVLPLFMIATSFAAQRVSRSLGRVFTSIAMAYIGSAALAGLWALMLFQPNWNCYDCPWHSGTNESSCEAALDGGGRPLCTFKRKTGSTWTCTPSDCGLNDNWYFVVMLYFLSTFQHCCRPLKKSILMDYTKKSTRGRWNSLDSVTRFGWSGSAVLGGYIIDRWDYGASFLATAIAQTASASVLFVLLPLLGEDAERPRMPAPTLDSSSSDDDDDDDDTNGGSGGSGGGNGNGAPREGGYDTEEEAERGDGMTPLPSRPHVHGHRHLHNHHTNDASRVDSESALAPSKADSFSGIFS